MHEPPVLRVGLVGGHVGPHEVVVLLEAVPDQLEVLGHVVDNRTQAGKAGTDDPLVVGQD